VMCGLEDIIAVAVELAIQSTAAVCGQTMLLTVRQSTRCLSNAASNT
jgi:hypothetical protein